MLKTRSNIFTILEKSKETILEFLELLESKELQKSCKQIKTKVQFTECIKFEYTKVNVKLTNLQLSKLKKAVKNNAGATLRISIKNFNKEDLPHELLLTTRQSTKLRNAINNNLATDVKFSKAQLKKIVQSG